MFCAGQPVDAVADAVGIDRKTALKIKRGIHAEQLDPNYQRCPECGAVVRPPCRACLDEPGPVALPTTSDRLCRLVGDIDDQFPYVPDKPDWLKSEWTIGAIVGRSQAGKSCYLRSWFPAAGVLLPWPPGHPICDCFPDNLLDWEIVQAFEAVGLREPRQWLVPYPALSLGERSAADAARVCSARRDVAAVDDFLSGLFGPPGARAAKRIAAKVRDGSFRARRLVIATQDQAIAEAVEPCWWLDLPRGTRRRTLENGRQAT